MAEPRPRPRPRVGGPTPGALDAAARRPPALRRREVTAGERQDVTGRDAEAAAAAEPAVASGDAEHAGLYGRVWRTGALNVLAISRRELGSYFISPIGYVVAALLAPVVGYIGYLTPVRYAAPVSPGQVYSLVVFLSIFFVPLLTMRLLAEERKQGTLEVMLTSPVRDWELVAGKWVGALLFYVVITAFVLLLVALMIAYQPARQSLGLPGFTFSIGNLDLGQAFTGYLGMLLVAAAFLAVGLLWSSLTQNQIIAAFAAFVSFVALYVVFGYGSFAEPPVSDVVSYLSAGNHFTSFNQGQLVLKDAVYFLTLIAGALFLTTRVLESRRWW